MSRSFNKVWDFFFNRLEIMPQKPKRIAIQGVIGSYHDIAAHEYFKEESITLNCCNSFDDLFMKLKSDETMLGMMAIENTIAGSLLHNNDLLRNSNTQIIGEHKLRISHCLVALPGTKMEDIEEIHSHPIALMQCRDFLNSHPHIKVVESEDTALSAEEIAKKKLVHRAAICSSKAAEINHLNILESGIETNKHNYTRFLVIADAWQEEQIRKTEHKNKSNIVFSLPHEEGSLSQVLSIFSFYKVNLTKIQSLPILGREWEYQFYIDLSFDDYTRYQQALNAVTPLTKALKVLGEYEAFVDE